MYDMLIQGIGLIAFALFLLSYQVRSNRRLFAMQTLGNLLFALQFFLLGGVGGAIGSLISVSAFAISSILLSIYRFGFHAMAENQFDKDKGAHHEV